jgi:hypothetical protein
MSPEPEELRLQAHHREKSAVARIQDELDAMIALTNHLREAYQWEINDGMGYKRQGVAESIVKKGVQLASMMDTLVKTKIAYDKAQKALSETMTPAEERAAVVAFIKGLEAVDRSNLLRDIRKWMRARNEDTSETL